jgi:peptide/nickel transport system substrate-binding protein
LATITVNVGTEKIMNLFSIIHKHWRQSVAVVLAGVCALALTSCNPSQFKVEAARVPQLVVASLSEPNTFNSVLNESLYSVFGYIYDGLITENPFTSELEPALAKSWEISPDKKRIIITLKDDIKWSDGEPMTADDVDFTYNQIYFNPKIPAPIKDALRIGTKGLLPTVKKLDERRVEFTVPEPFAPFLRYAGGLTILPAHALRESVETLDEQRNPKFLSTWSIGTNPQEIIGNGPYVMESYTPSQRVIFRRNPNYWRKDSQGNPQPYIDRIVMQIVESTDNQLISFRSGQLDTLEVAPEAFQLLKREEKRAGFKIYNGGPDTGTSFIAFNLNVAKNAKGEPLVDPIKSRWFNTKEFRQAVAYALDRETMKNNVFRGLGYLQNSFVYPKSPYYLSPEEGLRVYNYDPQKAKNLLMQAGFKYNDQNQLVDADGNIVRFTLLSNAERKTRVDMAAQIVRDLANIGIKVDLQVLSFNAYLDKLKVTQNWDCYMGGFGGGGIEPHSASNIWSVAGASHAFNQSAQPGDPPLIGWRATDWEKEIDRLYKLGAQELDEKKRKEIYGKYQRIAAEQLPFIHLVERLDLQAVSDRIENIRYSALGGAFWNLYELKVTK